LKNAIIIGAGPAGLTAAYELLTKTDIIPIIIEQDDMVGGLARTVNHKGNRIDIGGHRFFSKSDKVVEWWLKFLPLENSELRELFIQYQGKQNKLKIEPTFINPEEVDKVMLVRDRKSSIFYLRKFFDYPLSFTFETIQNLGLKRLFLSILSYLKSILLPIKKVTNLEQLFINRFGKYLFKIFFKDYTEKVWGKPCDEIDAEWGHQRIKSLSILNTIIHFLRKLFGLNVVTETETSLTEKFLYPKFGPGQLWETVASEILKMGGIIHYNHRVMDIEWEGNNIMGITAYNRKIGLPKYFEGDYFFSTMPIKFLIKGMGKNIPDSVRNVALNLEYRDFITIGILAKKEKFSIAHSREMKDNWIYIQENDVLMGRLQIFNNWSPYMVRNEENIWLGLEYFCNKDEDFWSKSDNELIAFASQELEILGFLNASDVLDATVIKMPHTYPAYFGSYDRFEEVIGFLNQIQNLFPIGRNGMHKYNNQDHSMLTAIEAVKNIIDGRVDKSNLWKINTEEIYHEEK
jgi:protoporphyrinogen oxidase